MQKIFLTTHRPLHRGDITVLPLGETSFADPQVYLMMISLKILASPLRNYIQPFPQVSYVCLSALDFSLFSLLLFSSSTTFITQFSFGDWLCLLQYQVQIAVETLLYFCMLILGGTGSHLSFNSNEVYFHTVTFE